MRCNMADASNAGYILVKGVRLPDVPLVKTDAKFVEDLDHFHTRKEDVFVVTYPKSGTIDFFYKFQSFAALREKLFASAVQLLGNRLAFKWYFFC